MSDTRYAPPQSMWQAIKRGVTGKCPQCGESKLWQSYIKQVDKCPVCHTKLGDVRADDGPAWLTILIVGHLWAPALVWITRYQIPMWILFPALMTAALLSCLAVLPMAKGLFIAAILKNQTGDEVDDSLA